VRPTTSTPVAQPVREISAVPVGSLEARVCGLVGALVEDRVERLRVEVRVERRPVGTGDAVRRPGVDEVGALSEMAARVDMSVPRRDDVAVGALRRLGLVPASQLLADLERDLGATGDA
jgi:hypothetical protein